MSAKEKDRLRRLARLRQLGVRKGLPAKADSPSKATSDPGAASTRFNGPDQVKADLADILGQLPAEEQASLETLVPGQTIQNSEGQYFAVERRFPLEAVHGRFPLQSLLQVSMSTLALISGDETWSEFSWSDILFIDTETTGLEIGAGTVAFLIGLGYLDGDEFVVRQLFMRDFDEEMALLHDLEELSQDFAAMVSFNGKTFDLPLLENRFVMARLFPDLLDAPHFDLLHPARRLWRRRLDNCKLSTLEAEILAVRRSQTDVPGYLIPILYRQYLENRDARLMKGIFYHNQLDIVSMAVLMGQMHYHLHYAHHAQQSLHPIDRLSTALWLKHLKDLKAAEAALKHSLSDKLDDELQDLALTELAYLLKRQGRHREAEAHWQQLAVGQNKLRALEELAKYYEWRARAYDKAVKCVVYALGLIEAELAGFERDEAISQWSHRRARLAKKLADQS